MIADTYRQALFDGKVALVTGAARGIGAAVSRAFANLGAMVLLQDIDTAGLAKVSSECAAARRSVAAIEGDLSKRGVANEVFDRALRVAGRVDFLVNNAGRSWAVDTTDITEDRTDELIELNLKSILWLCKRFIGDARERKSGGSIVQISSTAGVAGFERRSVYCATKFGLVGLTKSLALDHARDGIRVNAVLPHVVETEMLRTVARSDESNFWRAGIPMGRFAQAEDVAALVMFLCSPASAYLTGGLYPVDGGAMAGTYSGHP
jgi:NAD(P)-dependent dehydrogenase (short-subunit alcohol dehydrogenase family)